MKPNSDGSYFYNYKHAHSIIPLTIASAEYECLHADVGSNDRVNDCRTYNKCWLFQATDDESVRLPEDDYLANNCKLPYLFLGDVAFAMKKFMMKTYPQQNLAADKSIYN